MRFWRKLPVERRNVLVISVLILLCVIGMVVFQSVRRKPTVLIKVWQKEHGLPGMMYRAAFSPDGNYVLTMGTDLKIWRTRDGQLVRTLNFPAKGVRALSPNGKWLATYEPNGTITLWQLPEGKPVRTLKGDKGRFINIAFSPGSKFLIAESMEMGSVKVWQVDGGKPQYTLQVGANKIWGVAISPDGKTVATYEPLPGTVTLWHLPTKRRLRRWRARFLSQFVFSPDGKFLVGWGQMWGPISRALAWRLSDGKQITLLSKDQGSLLGLGVHPHSTFVLAGFSQSQDMLARFRPEGITIPSLLMTWNTLALWQLPEGKEVWKERAKVLQIPGSDMISSVAFSPDGRKIVVTTVSGKVILLRFTILPTLRP